MSSRAQRHVQAVKKKKRAKAPKPNKAKTAEKSKISKAKRVSKPTTEEIVPEPTPPTEEPLQSESFLDEDDFPEDEDEEDEEPLGSDDDEQEDSGDYCVGGYHPVKIGDLFHDRYHVVRKLGWGHFSTVWLSWDLKLRRYVALKVVKSAAHYTETAIDEISLLVAVRDGDPMDIFRNRVVSLLDNFKIRGPNGEHVCMVFEVLGHNLLKFIIKSHYEGLPVPVVKHIIKQTLEGLHYLHAKCAIIHTDIKPENILITVDQAFVRSLARETAEWMKQGAKPSNSAVSTAKNERKAVTEINSKMTKNQKKRARKKAKRTQELFDLQQKQLQELDMLDELQELEQEIGNSQIPTSEGDLKQERGKTLAGNVDSIQMNGETNSNASETLDDDLSIKLDKLNIKKDSSSHELNEEGEVSRNDDSEDTQGAGTDEAKTLTTRTNIPDGGVDGKNESSESLDTSSVSGSGGANQTNPATSGGAGFNGLRKYNGVGNGTSSMESSSERSLSNETPLRRGRLFSDTQATVEIDPAKIIVCPRTDIVYDLNKLNVKIADLGNSCWVHHHYTEDIQTRQYRSVEVLVGAGYDTSADIWSTACMAFELATGDFLFEPHSCDGKYSRDEDHIAHIIELLGDIPHSLIQNGAYSNEFFDNHGNLLHIQDLRMWPLYNVLREKYKWSEEDAQSFTSFLLPMLALEPEKRATAAQCLQHPWLSQ